jgi:hypothetical protein
MLAERNASATPQSASQRTAAKAGFLLLIQCAAAGVTCHPMIAPGERELGIRPLRPRQFGQLASLQIPHCNLAIGILALDQFRSSHRGEHRVSAGLSLAIKKDLEFSPLAVLVHLLQSSSASRFTGRRVRLFWI